MREFAWDVRESDVRRVIESRKKAPVMNEVARAQQQVLLQKDRLREVVLKFRGDDEQGAAARSVIEDVLIEEREILAPKQFPLPHPAAI
jgi:hypothetical protein